MNGPGLVRAILKAHKRGAPFEPYDGVVIEPQRDYQGLVATTGYREWRERSHWDRQQIGLFDVRILVRDEEMEHERSVILPTLQLLAPEMAESVFEGENPNALDVDREQRLVLSTLQAAMAEQEVNWGNEPFQCKSHFSPPNRTTHAGDVVTTRPRDLLMGFVRRCFDVKGGRGWSASVEDEIRSLLASRRGHKASRSSALMPKMEGGYVAPEWESFHRDPSGRALPWLSGDVLEFSRSYAAKAPSNPRFPTASPVT